MDISSLTCPICYDAFDQQEHLPKIILVCGHTVCSFCLKKLFDSTSPTCPFDKKSIGKKKDFKDFPVNYALVQLLERKVDERLCQQHQKNLSFACFTDKLKLCIECVSEGKHKKHKVKALDDLQLKVVPQKNELQDLLAHCEGDYEKINDTLKEVRIHSLECLRSNYEEIRNQLYRKELELAFEINSFYDSQLKRLKKSDEIDLTLKENIRMRLNTLVNFSQEIDPFESEDYFNATQKFINECRSKMKINKLNQEVELIQKGLRKNLKTFSKTIQAQVQPLLTLKFPLSDNLQNLMKLLPLNKIEESSREDLNILKVSTSLQIKQDGDKLEIVADGSDVNETRINLTELEMICIVSVGIKRELTAAREVEILNYIFKFLKRVKLFKLKLESGPISTDIFQIFSWCLDTGSQVEIDLKGYKDENQPVLPSVKTMLRKGSFEYVSLNISETKLAWNRQDKNSLKEIFEQAMIKSLDLEANSTIIPADYISGLVFPTSLKRLTLSFNHTKISRKAIGAMIRTALSSLQELQEINLHFHGTSITDEELNNVTIRSKVLSKFCLDIGRTVITNKAVECLSKTLMFCASTLDTLIIGFGATEITDESLNCFCMQLPRLRYLNCHLGFTLLSDKSVESIVDNLIVPSANLQYLTLGLFGTKITDVSLRKISGKLEKLKGLELNLKKTLITDKGMIHLIREILPTKTNLTIIELDTTDTAVSETIRNEVNEFVKNRSKPN